MIKHSRQEIIDLGKYENTPKVPVLSDILDYKKDIDELINTVNCLEILQAQGDLFAISNNIDTGYRDSLRRFEKQQNWKSTSTCILILVLAASILIGGLIKFKVYA